MARYLLDTNHISAAIRPVSKLRERIYHEQRKGHRFGTCVPVIAELEAGIYSSQHASDYHRDLGKLLKTVRLWPLDVPTARLYGQIHLDLRRRGRVLSQVDMILAALAGQMNLTMLTTDRDFEALPDLRTENWLS